MADHRDTPSDEETVPQREERERKGMQEPPNQDDRRERERWFFASRVGADGKVPPGLFAKASAQRRRLERKRKGKPPTPPGSGVNWTPIGPSVVAHGQASGQPAVSGRINAIAVGPGGSRVYAGAANGGVWFSSNGGANWAPLDDYSTDPSFVSGLEEDSLSVGALAVHFGATAANDTIFVGTGEPTGTTVGAPAYFGIGIRYSPSGGAPGTWSLEGTNMAGHAIYRIVIDPDDPTRVYAATFIGLYQRPTSGSVANWTQISGSPHFATDLIVAGSGASKRYYAATTNGVYSSPDAVNWTAIPGISTMGRTVLAAGENDPSIVYALNSGGTLYRLASGSFQQVSGVPHALFFGGQGEYDLVLAVDPANANTIYMAGDGTLDGDWSLSFYKGTITGGPGSYTFPFNSANDIFTNALGLPDSSHVPSDPTWIGRGIHADAHSFAFATNPGGTHDGSNVWIGTDGGIFQSTMSGARGSFVAHNTGLAITELTFMAQWPYTDAAVFSGSQDNGTVRGWGEQAWFESAEGDGGGVAIDPNNQYQVMRQYTKASLWISTDGGASGSWSKLNFPPTTSNTMAQQNAANNESGGTNFYAPIAVSQASPAGQAPTLAAFGTHRLWLTDDWGTTWVTLPTATNPYSSATPDQTQDQLDGPIVTIAFASGTRTLIFAATPFSVYWFESAGGAGGPWIMNQIPTTGFLPPGYIITALAVENPTTGSFYVTLGSWGLDHVWYFDGTTWQNAGLSHTTIDAPTHAVVVDPANSQHLYIGTDVGCWQGIKTAPNTWTWNLFSSGLPEAAITDIGIHARARLLRVATHGRGIWEIPLDATSGIDPDVYMRVNYADTGRVQGSARFAWVEHAQDPTAVGYHVYHWMSADIKVRRGSFSGLPALNTPPDYLDFATNIGDFIDPTTHVETADPFGSDRIFVEVHNRGLTPIPGSQVRVLLLLTGASAGLPALPANYADSINAGDSSSSWLAGTPWFFADPTTPYRTLPGILDVRTPQVVEYDVDLTLLTLMGQAHVCAAAFVTTTLPTEKIRSTNTNLDQVTMQDKHIVFRNLQLGAAGTHFVPGVRPHSYLHLPLTFVIDFHNATPAHAHVDLVFQRPHFPGSFSLLLPKLALSGPGAVVLKGWKVVEHSELETAVRTHLGHWLERVGELVEHLGEALEQKAARLEQEVIPSDIRDVKVRKLGNLDRTRVYVADHSPTPTIAHVPIPAGGSITAAVTVKAPANAKPGDRFRFEVMQKRDGEIVGGSTYVFVVIPESSDQ